MSGKSRSLRSGLARKPDLVAIGNRFRVLSVPTRLAILQALHDGEMTVSVIAETVGTSQPNVSKHLRVLVDAGMVARREEGATSWCRIADTLVFKLCDLVCEGAWEPATPGRVFAPPKARKARTARSGTPRES